MAKLILLRHLLSQWNQENRFSGWTDVPLSEEGMKEASAKAEKIAEEKIEAVYTSPLSRNKNTSFMVLEKLGYQAVFLAPTEKRDLASQSLPVYITDTLNERSYGLLEGVNKGEVLAEFGEEKTYQWRRSWNIPPPAGESLKDVYSRAIPFYQEFIEPKLKAGQNILIVASHNSLRAIVKYLEKISDEEIINLEIPFGGLVVYDLDENLTIKSKTIK